MQLLDFFKYTSSRSRLLQLVALSLFLGLMALALSVLLFGRDINNPDTIRAYQFFQTIGVFLLPPLLLSGLWYGNVLGSLHLNKRPKFSITILVLLIQWVSIPGINLLGELNKSIVFPESLQWLEDYLIEKENRAGELTHLLLSTQSYGVIVLNLIIVAVLPAFAEEFYFRGVIQSFFQRWGKHLAVWSAAFVFSAVHLQFFGFLPRMVFGAVFGYFLVWSGNLWYPIIAHFVNNASLILTFSFLNPIGTFEKFESLGTTANQLWLGVLSLFLSTGLVFLFKKKLDV